MSQISNAKCNGLNPEYERALLYIIMPIRSSPTLLKLDVATHPILWSVRKNMQVISNRYPWSLTKWSEGQSKPFQVSIDTFVIPLQGWNLVTVRKEPKRTTLDRRNRSAGFSCLRTLVNFKIDPGGSKLGLIEGLVGELATEFVWVCVCSRWRLGHEAPLTQHRLGTCFCMLG